MRVMNITFYSRSYKVNSNRFLDILESLPLKHLAIDK